MFRIGQQDKTSYILLSPKIKEVHNISYKHIMTDNILYTVFTKCYLKVGKGRYLLSLTKQLCN